MAQKAMAQKVVLDDDEKRDRALSDEDRIAAEEGDIAAEGHFGDFIDDDGAGPQLSPECAEKENALQILRQVRKLLVEGLAGQKLPSTFASPLSNDVPVKNQVREGFHGYCDIHVRGWHDHGAGCHATSFTVHSISLQLTMCGKLLPVELLIATFIHELAHTVTRPEMRLASTVPASVLKLQPQVTPGDRLVPVHHSDDFYANFRELLRLAERLSIFTLPPGPNKFSQKALMRFDNTDPDASLAGMNLGRSDRFGTALGGKRRPLRALLTAAGSRSKSHCHCVVPGNAL